MNTKKDEKDGTNIRKKRTAQRDKYGVEDAYGINAEQDYYTCSSSDCTGLIPAGIVDDEELEAYQELYPDLYPDVSMKKEIAGRKKD